MSIETTGLGPFFSSSHKRRNVHDLPPYVDTPTSAANKILPILFSSAVRLGGPQISVSLSLVMVAIVWQCVWAVFILWTSLSLREGLGCGSK